MSPISGLTLTDFDRDPQDAGCCSCLGFLRKPDRELDSFLGEGCYGDVEYGGYLCEDRGRIPGLPRDDRVICREVPVKLTAQVTMGEEIGWGSLLQSGKIMHFVTQRAEPKEYLKIGFFSQDADGKKMINEYVRECNIGRGSYGKVVLYRKVTDGKNYAIKAFYKSRLSKIRVTSSETAWTDVLREVSIMKTVEHPNIINLIEVIDDTDSDRFFMVLEYVEGKCICDASGQGGGIGEETSRRRLRDIISGLTYLHAHRVVHGDIKPENLLVTKSGAVKIGDFSISHAFEDENDLLWRSPGTPVFTAPECCIGLNYHGRTADVWAVGVTLYCMIFGHCPFIGESLQDTYDKIVNSPLHISEDLDPELEELLGGLLCKDPSQRMTLESAARHPWLARVADPTPSPCKCRCGLLGEGR